MNGGTQVEASASPARGLVRGFAVLGLCLAPSLLAIALTPGFSTQDGPAHIYSARIMNASLARDSPFAATFRVAWEPIPNWAGHLVTMGAVAIWSPEVANRVMTAATLVCFAAAVLWLRWVVAGSVGIELAAILAALLAHNVTWLLGFTSFLLGGTLAAITMATWWSGRDRSGLGQTVRLGVLLVLGYFCHPISLGLTLGALMILVTLTPGSARAIRLGWTMLAGVPLIPLGLAYRALTRSGGALEPVWRHVGPSVGGLISQVGWVDPLSLAAKTVTPFDLQLPGVPASLVAPAVWVVVALVVLVILNWSHREPDRAGWLVIAAGLVGTGLVAPDTLGARHGHFLPQRIVLLGLVALVPWLGLGLDRGRRGIKFAAMVMMLMALVVQSALVWDYARTCRDRVGPFLRVATVPFEPGTTAGTLLNAIRGQFRANPLLHADGLIAASTDSIFWTNYETAQYYFPVKVRANVAHPVATAFEQVAILDEPADAAWRASLWRDLLRKHAIELDRIVEWQADTDLDAITQLNYAITYKAGPIRIWSRLPPARSLE